MALTVFLFSLVLRFDNAICKDQQEIAGSQGRIAARILSGRADAERQTACFQALNASRDASQHRPVVPGVHKRKAAGGEIQLRQKKAVMKRRPPRF